MTRAAAAAVACVAALAVPSQARAWGFAAHRIVTESAVEALTEPLASFYRSRLRRISDASIEPDTILRAREKEAERRRHYLDLDELSRPPFADIPASEVAARELFGSARVDEAGTLPWRAKEIFGRLREAFAGGDWKQAARLSGWLAHYAADACQPLHTTRNFDGQLTGNDGVHAAFETDLIDRDKAAYRRRAALPSSFEPGAVGDPAAFVLATMVKAHDLAGAVLAADTEAMRRVKKQGKDYFEELEARAGEIAARQMRESAAAVAALWHAAWVEAGRPRLREGTP